MDKFLAQRFARGGEASLDSSTEAMNKYLLAEEEASPMAYATVPSAPTEVEAPDMSTAKSMLKRLATKGERGKSSRPKGMGMQLGDLTPAIPEIGAPPTEQEKLVKIATARSQFDALERAYKLKAIAAAKSGKGLSRPTFNALAFDQPTLEKPGPLMARTFQFGGLVKGMKAMGKKGTPDPAQLMPSSAARGAEEAAVASPSIIKDEGGNWMKGSQSVEEFVKPLKKGAHEVDPRIAAQLGITPDPKQKSLNQWIDKKMTPYIKNKMATPSDPLRKLAEEEGILPFPDRAINGEVTANINRIAAGLPVEQQAPLAKTERGQAWENTADAAITVAPYKEMIPFGYSDNISNNMDEVLRAFGGEFAVQNPTAKVSGMNTGRGPTQLGFDHVIDVLQESMTTGRLSADSLRGLSMEDAVRLTHQYDQDMAKKIAEGKIQSLLGVPVYKAYPEQGFRWMQLDKPGYFAAESDAMGHSVRGYEPPVGHPDWTPQSGNKGNLSYGSYGGWEAIKKGDVKIYSLADDQGKRYTTVEAVKAQHPLDYPAYSLESRARGETGFPEELLQDGSIPQEKLQEIYALGKKLHYENPNAYAENRILTGAPAPSPMDSFQKAADQVIGELPFDIAQIKGQVNTSVKGEAQPFVQDFLNSGNWSEVSDLSLTGLRDIKKTPELENYIKSNQLDNRRFLTEAEYNKYENDFLRGELKGQLGGFDPMAPSPVQPEGMAEGGEAKKSLVTDIGKWLKENDISPTDLLTILGKTGGTLATALTPSTLNEREAEELARRRTLPPTIDRAEGSPQGGEAKKDEDLPGLLGVSSYARGRAAGMFPEESSQWTSQDTARHMLASGTLARKYGPRIAELAGYAHEIKEQPIKFIGAKLGMTKESPDYTQDVHNNLLGIELASRSKSQEDLLELVKQMASDARDEQTPGKAWKGRPSGSSPSVGRYGSQGPIKRQEGSPKTGELPNIEDTSSAPFEMIKGAGRMNIEDKQIENMMLGLGTNSSMLGLDLSKMKQGEKENLAKNLMAAYRTKIGETDVNVRGMRPMDAPPGTYMGNISAAVPVYGNDRMIVGMSGMQTPYQSGRTGYNLGYSGQVGPGRLDAMMMQPKDSSQGRGYQVQYRMPIGRADGSPATGEGELTQAEIDAASKPAFITPSSGIGRKAGNISKALASGRALSAAAEGVTELPYDIAGLPMDIVMLARQALTGLEPTGQFGTSDYIKKQMTGLGIRPEPPADPTEKGFYTAGELLSNLTNPAAVTRGGVKAAQKTGQAVGEAAKTLEDLTVGEVQRARVRKAGKKAENIPDTAYDPLRERLEATGNLAYISRPPGGYFPTSRGMAEKTAEEINNTKLSDLPEEFVSWLNTEDKKKTSFLGLGPKESLGNKYNRWKAETGNRDYSFGVLSSVDTALQPVLKKITKMEPGEKRDSLFLMFNQKAKDFYSKQAGSIQDPLRADILSGKLKFNDESDMGDVFPKVLVKQAAQGNLQALRLLEKNYDDMLGIRASVPYKEGLPVPPTNQLRTQIIENIRDNLDTVPDTQLLAYAGKKPLPGPDGVAEAAKEVRLKLKENPNLFSTVLEPNIKRTIFAREPRPISDLEMARFPGIYGTTATKSMINPQMSSLTQEQLMAMPALPEGYFLPELETAIAKGQPILDTREYDSVKLLGLGPEKLFQEANKLSPTELQTLSFNEFVKRAYASTQEIKQLEKELEKVKPLLQQGKNPPAEAMLFGVTDFLPTVNDMRWVKVTNPDGVKSIAAGMNNSVGSYATTDTYGALGRGRRALDSGEVEVYSLYDKNHIPQVTVEYVTNKPSVPEKLRGRIVQLTGNGPLTANAAPEKFSEELVDFVNQLKLSPEQVPVSVKKILENNFFKFDEGKFVRNEEDFNKLQETRKKLGLAKGGSVDKNMAFIKKHT